MKRPLLAATASLALFAGAVQAQTLVATSNIICLLYTSPSPRD